MHDRLLFSPATRLDVAIRGKVRSVFLLGLVGAGVPISLVFQAPTAAARMLVVAAVTLSLCGLYRLTRQAFVIPAAFAILLTLLFALAPLPLEPHPAAEVALIAPGLLWFLSSFAADSFPARLLPAITAVALASAFGLFAEGIPGFFPGNGTRAVELSFLVAIIAAVLVVAGFLAWLSSRHVNQNASQTQHLLRSLNAAERQNALLSAQLLAVKDEAREHLAYTIHDGPLQDLAALLLDLETCKRLTEKGATKAAVAGHTRMREEMQEVISKLRTLSVDPRPVVLDDCSLVNALRRSATEKYGDTGLAVRIDGDDCLPLHAALETVVFQIVQEALTNIHRHARARHAWISLDCSGETLRLDIADDGEGFAVQTRRGQALNSGHLGLASMYGRAKAVGGELTIASTPGAGTRIQATFSLDGHSHRAETQAVKLEPIPATSASSPINSGFQRCMVG